LSLAFNKSVFDLGERIGGENMANLKHEIRNADARDASLARVRRAPEKVSVRRRLWGDA
jgi:hypothetical protein